MIPPQYIVPPLIFVVGAAIIASVTLATRWGCRKRRMALAAWAQKEGLYFSPERDDLMVNQFSDLKCFDHGRDRYAENVISGAWQGYGIQAFDYHFTSGYGRTETDHAFPALVVGAPARLKPLFIRPAGFRDKVAQTMGTEDIQFESAEFNRKFVVHAPDRKWAYDVLHPRAMELLLQTPSLAIEFSERSVIASRDGCFKVPDFAQALALVVGLLDLLPNYVMQQEVVGGDAS